MSYSLNRSERYDSILPLILSYRSVDILAVPAPLVVSSVSSLGKPNNLDTKTTTANTYYEACLLQSTLTSRPLVFIITLNALESTGRIRNLLQIPISLLIEPRLLLHLPSHDAFSPRRLSKRRIYMQAHTDCLWIKTRRGYMVWYCSIPRDVDIGLNSVCPCIGSSRHPDILTSTSPLRPLLVRRAMGPEREQESGPPIVLVFPWGLIVAQTLQTSTR